MAWLELLERQVLQAEALPQPQEQGCYPMCPQVHLEQVWDLQLPWATEVFFAQAWALALAAVVWVLALEALALVVLQVLALEAQGQVEQ